MGVLPVASVARSGDELVVRPLVGLLPEMKSLGARWDRPSSTWRLPAARMHLAAIHDLLGEVELVDDETVWDLFNVRSTLSVDDDRLYDWQRPPAARLLNSERGMLLCATPGLGKTAMSIVAADLAVPDDQVVVVSPPRLRRTWARAIQAWGKGDASTAIVAGPSPDWEAVRAARWVVVSWDVLALHQEWFLGRWPLWILDESVLAKSRKSTRAMSLSGGQRKGKLNEDGTRGPGKSWENLRRGIERVWLLSGSPTTKYADDLWAQLKIMWPKAFPSYWRFAERYCVVEETVWAKRVKATRRDMDVVADNSDFVVVVDQESVIDLPEYLFEAIDVELTPKQARAYQDMSDAFVATLDSGAVVDADNRMDQLMKLQKIVSYWDGSSAKHDALVELIEGGAYDPPYLVWTHWREGALALAERLGRSGLKVGHALGGLTDKVSDGIIQDYVDGRSDALVLSLGVGKFGHTLTNTRTAFYVDKTWNADDYFQSLLRVRRIGLAHRPVLATLRAPGTVDELLEMNLEGKVEGIARVTNASLKALLLGLGR